MSSLQWTLSALLALHVVSLSLNALPHPQKWVGLERIRNIPEPYVRTIGIEQKWNMFAPPGRFQQYLRVRYFWRDEGGTYHSVDRLEYPPTSETLRQPFRAYRASFERKSVEKALRNHARLASAVPPSSDRRQVRDPLDPVLRTLAARHRRHFLPRETDRLVRVEAWVGREPIRPPGRAYEVNEDALAPYQPNKRSSEGFSAPGSIELERSIQWRLVTLLQL